jgi:hypothetical protein
MSLCHDVMGNGGLSFAARLARRESKRLHAARRLYLHAATKPMG